MKKLGGIQFVYRGIDQDYCFIESIQCLLELCDQVVILDAGSQDGTCEEIDKVFNESHPHYSKLKKVFLPEWEWKAQTGREKLSYFQNLALSNLDKDCEYYFLLQSDECIHEDSFKYIRQAMETGEEGFMCRRYNMWFDSEHYLDVPPTRKPVSDYVIRLAKTQYYSVDDGESILCVPNTTIRDLIEITHVGFIREKYKHLVKMKNMQENVFGWGLDERAKGKDYFSPHDYFTMDDVVKREKPLPKFIKEWCEERDAINK